MPTQEEKSVCIQRQRNLSVRIDLYDFDFNMVESIEGMTREYNFTIDATSDIRRTCNLKIYDLKGKLTPFYLMDKYLKVYVGIKSIKTKEIVWTNMGVYIINNPNIIYSATENTLTIQCLDLMARLTGSRYGNLEGLAYQIPMYSSIKDSIIAVLKEFGFTKYVVEDVKQYVPYDIKIAIGGNAYTILKQLRDILPNYQIYFDVDGVFHYDKIPSGAQEQIFIDNNTIDDLLIKYNKNVDFESVKNSIEVFGKTHENYLLGGVAELTEEEGISLYKITVENIGSLIDNMKIKFTTPNKENAYTPYLKINDIDQLMISNVDGSRVILEPNKDYVFLYKSGIVNINYDGFVILDETDVPKYHNIDFHLIDEGFIDKDPTDNFTIFADDPTLPEDFNNEYNVSFHTPKGFTFPKLYWNNPQNYGRSYYYGNVVSYDIYDKPEDNSEGYFNIYFSNEKDVYDPITDEDKFPEGTTIDIKISLNYFYAQEAYFDNKKKKKGIYLTSKPDINDTFPNGNVLPYSFILNKLKEDYEYYEDIKNMQIKNIIFDVEGYVFKLFVKKDKALKNTYYSTYFRIKVPLDENKIIFGDILHKDNYVRLSPWLEVTKYSYEQIPYYYEDDKGKTKKAYDYEYNYTVVADGWGDESGANGWGDHALNFNNLIKDEDVNISSIAYLNNKSITIGNQTTIPRDKYINTQYAIIQESSYFTYLGQQQPYAKIQETNPSSPFYVNGNLGEIRIVLSGGDYDNIYSDALALERAKWELYNRCRLQDSITITCAPIYWADVNKLITITIPNEGIQTYIIKSISINNGVEGVQTLQCMKYYSYYDES